ncbi:uncharacterized protein LOC141699868 [Apium graveolens]|uniref:uncharacterized protein LOC141699868 n=1 Tax=Apium graveolens TaxID=4045 RepID=UPI003D7B50EF
MAATQNTNQNDVNSSSVYYVHPSDANVNQLVSVKFNGNGYNNWKRSMMLMLSAKNKLSFVNGTVVVPVPGTDEYKAWERCNDLVISWILYYLDETNARSVLFLKSTRDIWKDLEDRFGYASITQIYSLEQQLSELTQGQQSVSEFYTKIKTLWDSIDDTQPLHDNLQKDPPLLLGDLQNGLYALSPQRLIDSKACVSMAAVEKSKL